MGRESLPFRHFHPHSVSLVHILKVTASFILVICVDEILDRRCHGRSLQLAAPAGSSRD